MIAHEETIAASCGCTIELSTGCDSVKTVTLSNPCARHAPAPAVPDPTVETLSEHRLTTPVQCKCGWRETDGDPANSEDRWATHVATILAAPDALRVGVEWLADELNQWCTGHCRACRDPEFAARHSHDCGITRREVVERLRALLEDGA